MPQPKIINVVFEYNEQCPTHTGCRYFVGYPSDAEVEEQQRECKEPGSKLKIVAIGVTNEEASALCHSAMVNGGFATRRAAIMNDAAMPPEVKAMELMQLALLEQIG